MPAPQRPADRQRTHPRTITMLVCGFAAVLLFSVVGLAPVPYAIMKPGPVRDTLAEHDGKPLIEISGHQTYPTGGALDLTTVMVLGGPGRGVSLFNVITSWIDPTEAVLPVDEVYPPDQSERDLERQNTEEMVSSQKSATAAAMNELGIAVPTTLTVAGFPPSSKADGPLATDDVITAVNGGPVPDLPQLRDRLQQVPPGEPATITVHRAGRTLDVPVTTLAGEHGSTLLGVLIDPSYRFPFDVKIQIDNIGGPSAGMMFALGIIDKLTPGEMTGGQKIAGTGTIDSAGTVGPIGGIEQKLVAAQRAGARWFLAPADNCPMVRGHVPDGLDVVRVATLSEARTAVESIGEGHTGALPSCGG
jgi:PDZ domain-containing protein